MAEEIEKQLVQQRTTSKGSLSRVLTYAKRFNNGDDIQQLAARNTKLEELWQKYDKIQTELENINYDNHEKDRETFETNYYDAKAFIDNIFNSQTSSVTTNSSSNNVIEHNNPKVKLPQINLPTFSGDYEQWRNFYDMFIVLIHENSTIANVQKFYYLKSALKGEALAVIESITASSQNYEVALKLLIERYNNKQHIINAHIKALMELPTVGRDSTSNLRKLSSETKQHMRSLQTLEVPVQHWDMIMIYIITQKLDTLSRREWELSKIQNILPTLDQLLNFVDQRCFSLESLGVSFDKSKSKVVHIASNGHDTSATCILCKGKHNLYNCERFLKQNIAERNVTVQTLKACFNCLRVGHGVRECKSSNCRKCAKKHNTLIHNDSKEQQTKANVSQQQIKQTESSIMLHSSKNHQSQVLLATAIVKIQDNFGNWQQCRALLDSGAQSNFATSSLINRLKCKTRTIHVPIKAIGQLHTTITQTAEFEITSVNSQYKKRLPFLVLETITVDLPLKYVDQGILHLPNVRLADPNFGEPRQIDLLIGAEVYFDLLHREQIKLGKGLPILQNTRLGWIVSGKLEQTENNHETTCLLTTSEDINTQLVKFWEIEEYPKIKHLSQEQILCEEHYRTTVQRNETGRFIVKLPFKEDEPQLGDSYTVALKRFSQLERRLNSDSLLKQQYNEFINEYIKLKHMQCNVNDNKKDGYYLPHHAIIKLSSLSTKLRVVFDGSAKSSNNKSLNDTLMVGPTIQDDIFSILTRFRCHNIVLTADVEKMYRQIQIDSDDIKYQKILWRVHESQPIQTFNLTTITYGTASAPFQAIRTLHQLAEEEKYHFPLAASVVKNDFYVDDLLTGTNTIEEACTLKDQLIIMFERGGFKLRKWLSNCKDVLDNISNQSKDPLLLLDASQTVKTLGLQWNAYQDSIHYIVNDISDSTAVTKRQILSQIAKLYDPLGLVGPVIVISKLIMQQLWQVQTDWDEVVPSDIVKNWCYYVKQLQLLNEIIIPRKILIDNAMAVQLHGFSDASENAYGACLYLRSTDHNGIHISHLICSKSRVAPLRKLSVPRLELCAALLLANLYQTATKALGIKFHKVIFWSDSTITLYWINTYPHKLKTFIANRVAEIQSLTNPSDWHHVKSEENAADIITRGAYPHEIINAKLWWNGPDWLTTDEDYWRREELCFQNIPRETLELKPNDNAIYHTIASKINIFEKYSSITKLQRILAYCYRFSTNSKCHIEQRTNGALTTNELKIALTFLIKAAQSEKYHQEIHNLKLNKPIPINSELKSLTPFIDNNDILRVGGRLKNSNLPYGQIHQIILPPKHILTTQILKREHVALLHAGVQSVLNNIRQKYWPVQGRNTIRNIIHTCIVCFKWKRTAQQQLMGDLPSSRVQATRPFLNTGVDYGGPIILRKARNSTTKAYIALFICMSTKAIHLELVTSLTAGEFIAALKRFTARRGKCVNLYSDNGTNFRGADKELRNLYEFIRKQETREDIETMATTHGIQWHFIPPSAPHFGGLWEAGIKRVKFHIKRIIGENKLTYEEFYTLLTQIEACINSRPLTPIYDQPNDLHVLTPAHFLIGEPLTLIPEPDLTEAKINRLTRWQLIQEKLQRFWKRWSTEYLHHIQQRSKWTTDSKNVKVGTMVLIIETNLPPTSWRIARVIEVHPGEDGRVRVVTVKTTSGTMKRPIAKLCPLPNY